MDSLWNLANITLKTGCLNFLAMTVLYRDYVLTLVYAYILHHKYSLWLQKFQQTLTADAEIRFLINLQWIKLCFQLLKSALKLCQSKICCIHLRLYINLYDILNSCNLGNCLNISKNPNKWLPEFDSVQLPQQKPKM